MTIPNVLLPIVNVGSAGAVHILSGMLVVLSGYFYLIALCQKRWRELPFYLAVCALGWWLL